ncbi:MAG: hypothetical protein MUP85_20950 [Candidatus Lokiarchaeota archaeon]|nr:hypothetical protein [Candidatus Lokiarchaeota archaeon]
MPDSNEKKLIVKLLVCSRCGNAFMINDDKKEVGNLVCDNCIKLEQRKKILSESVIESQKETESNIREFKSHLRSAKSQQIKQLYFDKIKEESDYLSKSIELLKKIEETNDEKYIEEYKKLFEKLKNL